MPSTCKIDTRVREAIIKKAGSDPAFLNLTSAAKSLVQVMPGSSEGLPCGDRIGV
jgi:hypothetical protein